MKEISKLAKFLNNKHVKYGIPFILTIVGGSFIVREFATVRYEFRKVETVSREELLGDIDKDKLVDPKELTLEAQYKKLEEKKSYEKWENKRIPRPYDDE